MNKLFFLLVLISLKTCECEYKGYYSFVNWNPKLNAFENISVNIGELKINPNIENCFCKKNQITIEGIVQSKEMLSGSERELKSYVVILECDDKNKIVDTLFSTKLNGKFKFSLIEKNSNYVVFKYSDNPQGIKYKISNFKK
ncbi:hypothetical protein [Flavobacterium sp.]|uniref:hypothetical protein n=1 Tax=Flavobacterium sp. TaxID=239 RepID=UPI003D29B6CA